jgi:hypothetical protein
MAQVTITLRDNPAGSVDTILDADPPIDLRAEGERTHELTDAQQAGLLLMEQLMGSIGQPVGPMTVKTLDDDDDQVGKTISVDLDEYR